MKVRDIRELIAELKDDDDVSFAVGIGGNAFLVFDDGLVLEGNQIQIDSYPDGLINMGFDRWDAFINGEPL